MQSVFFFFSVNPLPDQDGTVKNVVVRMVRLWGLGLRLRAIKNDSDFQFRLFRYNSLYKPPFRVRSGEVVVG